MFRFVHLADPHLGYQQYGLPERARDFAFALGRAVLSAIECGPSFVLVAGDFFHHRQVDALTLRQAIELLEPLRQAGIPVLTVAGNHDLGWRDGTETWLSLLHHLGYLRHMDLNPAAEHLLQPGEDGSGPVFENEHARVIGLPYLGASLPRVLGRLVEPLSRLERKYTVLLLHAGIEGTIPGVTEPLRHEHLAPLAGMVDYVALGHRHKPFERPSEHPPVFNPGSLETVAADEADEAGGWYAVEVAPDGPGRWRHTAVHRRSCRRPFLRLGLDISLLSTPEQVVQAVRDAAGRLPVAGRRAPLVDLSLYGSLRFLPSALNLSQIAATIEELTGALKALVRNHAVPQQGPTAPGTGLTRAALEHEVLLQAISRDSRYRSRASALASLAADVKRMALEGAADEVVFQRVLIESEPTTK
ncbi:MAG: exonuclease SbcCD subunit D [Anaerolineae bacterium]|nr:exonuclease SbcCD subunit D [Anaerolineae bacterium]